MTNVSDPAAKLYATALGEIGQEHGLLGRIYEDLQLLRGVQEDADGKFQEFFTSPRIDPEAKWDVLRTALEGKVCKPVLGLLHVLIAKGRGSLLDNVIRQFERFKDRHENRIHAYVTVAKPMDDAFRASLEKRLGSASGKTVAIHEQVDPDVLGGAAIRVGDTIIDRTLRTRLSALRQRLLAQD